MSKTEKEIEKEIEKIFREEGFLKEAAGISVQNGFGQWSEDHPDRVKNAQNGHFAIIEAARRMFRKGYMRGSEEHKQKLNNK
jgi:hypothetical protein